MRLVATAVFFAFMYFMAAIAAKAADFGPYGELQPQTQYYMEPPVVVVPARPTCQHRRIVEHDDILDVDDWRDEETCY